LARQVLSFYLMTLRFNLSLVVIYFFDQLHLVVFLQLPHGLLQSQLVLLLQLLTNALLGGAARLSWGQVPGG
jgi:hypothetical protein